MPSKIGLLVFLFLFSSQYVYAQYSMEGGMYKIEPQTKQNAVQPTRVAPDVARFGELTFEVSESIIDFGRPQPTNPLLRSNTITINSKGVKYFLKTYENHQLLSSKGSIIQDANCDDAKCSEKTSSVWKSVLAYGLGYRCEGEAYCKKEFPNKDSFKQFANTSREETPQLLLTGYSQANINISYKLNLSSNQTLEPYSNVATFLLLPSY